MVEHKALILCIDSDVGRAEGRRLLLEQSGYVVLVAITAKTGLDLFVRSPADIALVDHELPPVNGVVVTARLKRAKPNVPVVMFARRGGSLATGGPCSADAIVDEGQPWSVVLDRVNELITASGPFFQRWLQDWKNRGPGQPQDSRDRELDSIKGTVRAH
jgi:Response regulator receiver domain